MRKETLEIKCECGCWNTIPMHKFFLKHRLPKISVLITAYKATENVTCEKCGKVIAHAGESFRPRTTKQGTCEE
jgi:hypothetical protein